MITLTERAANHVNSFLAKRGKGVGLRLGVRTSGCSGLAYRIEYADAVNPEDQTFESHGVKVIVDPKSLQFLDGTELDFTREGLNEGLKFNNPTVKDECRRARRRAPRVDAAGDARERSLSDLEVAFAAGRLHPAIARRGSGVRDEYGDAARVPDGTVELARTHRSRVRSTPSPASVASRLARRERENL